MAPVGCAVVLDRLVGKVVLPICEIQVEMSIVDEHAVSPNAHARGTVPCESAGIIAGLAESRFTVPRYWNSADGTLGCDPPVFETARGTGVVRRLVPSGNIALPTNKPASGMVHVTAVDEIQRILPDGSA